MTTPRHRWAPPVRFPFKTERECLNGCGVVRVTRHEAEGPRAHHWTEFWRDAEQIPGDATPACEGEPQS